MKNLMITMVMLFVFSVIGFGQHQQPDCKNCTPIVKKTDKKSAPKKSGKTTKAPVVKKDIDTLRTPSPEIVSGIGTPSIIDTVKPTGRVKAIIDARAISSTTPIADWGTITGTVGYRLSQKWRKELGLYTQFTVAHANISAESTYVSVIAGAFYSPIKGVRLSGGAGTEFTNSQSGWCAQAGLQSDKFIDLGGTIRVGTSGTTYRVLAGSKIGGSFWAGINAESLPYSNGDVVGPFVQIPIEDTPFTLTGGASYRLKNDVPSEMRWGGSVGISASLF